MLWETCWKDAPLRTKGSPLTQRKTEQGLIESELKEPPWAGEVAQWVTVIAMEHDNLT